MKRTLFVLLFPLLLSGCAQLFDTNLFAGVDAPPALDADALADASVGDIQSMMSDPSFLEQLQDDPEALEAAQGALDDAMRDPDASDAEAIQAGATLIAMTAGGSGVADLNENLTSNITSIADAVSAGDFSLALKLFMGDKSESEIKDTLDNLVVMAQTLAFMQDIAAPTGTSKVNETIFFSGTDNRGSFAQAGLMAAISYALVKDNSPATTAALATAIATDAAISNSGNDMSAFSDAQEADASAYTKADGVATPGSGYSYTYVATLMTQLSIF